MIRMTFTNQKCNNSSNLQNKTSFIIIISSIFILAGSVFAPVYCQQTREQCYDCCAESGYDDYYTEQCRLKCFRNTDHCVSKKAKQTTATAKPTPDVAKPEKPKPAEQQTVSTREQPARPQPRRAEFVWPNPLNLVPGREIDAASQILALNGVVPQHPNYAQALRAVEALLIDFGRNNPAGGALPTAQLERLVGQFR
ncbi:MAG: hypothetical protein AB7V04_08515 [Desulfomonilaceae bacterium]